MSIIGTPAQIEPLLEIHPALLKRKIIHVDMDAFYAAIEIRDNPQLKGQPVVVGGNPNSRAVVCTANYEARKFGIRSAMACSQAARLCPQAVFLQPNFEKYRAVSKSIREIFGKYTSKIEPLSLDEAYLDVSGHEIFAVKIARLIQEEILAKLQLSCSVGVAPNKLIAKIASEFKKPGGLTLVLPKQVVNFMSELSLRKIHGIGPVSEKKLKAKGFLVCKDVWPFTREELALKLGQKFGFWLYDSSRGIDERPVECFRKRKSIGKEITFSSDLFDARLLANHLKSLCISVSNSLIRQQFAARTISLKVKYEDFTQITRSKTMADNFLDAEIIFSVTSELLAKEVGKKKIRLLGVSLKLN